MTPAKISSSLQDRVSLYQKLAQSGNDKQNNGIERLSLVRITQSPVERKFSHLQRQRPQLRNIPHPSHIFQCLKICPLRYLRRQIYNSRILQIHR